MHTITLQSDSGRHSTPRAGKPSNPPPKQNSPPRNHSSVVALASTRISSAQETAPCSLLSPKARAGTQNEELRRGLPRTREPVFHAQARVVWHNATENGGDKKFRMAPRGRASESMGVIKLEDTWAAHGPRAKAGEEGKMVGGVLIRPARPSVESIVGTRPHTAAAVVNVTSMKAGRVSNELSKPGDNGDSNDIGVQTDSPKRWVAGRGATYAYCPVESYEGGVEVNSRQPKGPFVHGEDIRFIGPKKRGGVAQIQGIKALTASGRLMGSEVRAWWPDEAPPDDGYIPGPGETSLWQSSPYAVGRDMDRYDRRTFGPNMSHAEWLDTCKELKKASTKLSEMERSLRQGMLLRAKALSKEASIVGTNSLSPTKVPESIASAISQVSTCKSAMGPRTKVAETVVSAGSHVPGYVMGGRMKVKDWLSPRKAPSEATTVDMPKESKVKTLPDYEKLERGARLGDAALKTLRGQEVLSQAQHVRDNPPKLDSTNQRSERPHAIRKFRYYDKGDELLKEKRIRIPEDALKCLPGSQTHRPVSAAVQTNQGVGTYQRSSSRDLVAEAVNQINQDRNKNVTPRRRDKVFADRLWSRFKGAPDKPYMFTPRVRPGIDEKILARVVADQIQPEIWISNMQGVRQPAARSVAHDGVNRPGEPLLKTPEHELQIVQRLFPRGPGAVVTPAQSEASGIRRALEVEAGIGVGNPLLQNERISIKYV